ncbi:MAG: hypothetical protein WC763_01870 [Candidatus Paceibacterota bacterium]|jgi:hypothetical protein
MKFIKNLLSEKIRANKKNLKTFSVFVLCVAAVSTFMIATPFFTAIGPTVFLIVFGTFFSILWFMAGYAVFRSLLAASVGLSLIIYIGQSYCDLPEAARTVNDSVTTLIGIGWLYVIAQFGRSMFRELFGDEHAKEEWRRKGIVNVFKEANQGRHSWLALVTYGLGASLIIWQVYSVINPIIDGLCVYN